MSDAHVACDMTSAYSFYGESTFAFILTMWRKQGMNYDGSGKCVLAANRSGRNHPRSTGPGRAKAQRDEAAGCDGARRGTGLGGRGSRLAARMDKRGRPWKMLQGAHPG